MIHRIPWGVPYAYTEVDVEGLTQEEMTNVMFDVVSMEEAYRSAYGLPKIGESNTVAVYEQAIAPRQVENRQAPQMGGYVDHTSQYTCKQCGGRAERAEKPVKTPRMKRPAYPIKCASGCKDDRGYAFTTAWEDA